jgi:hypothetical protein
MTLWRFASRALGLAAHAAFSAPLLQAQSQEPPPGPSLRKVIQLNDAQLAAIDKGEVVTKLLPAADKPEIAAFGVVKTAGSPDVMIRLAKDVRKFRQVPQIPEMGLFSSPPRLEDLKGLMDKKAPYPKGRLAHIEDILYWNKDEFGLSSTS